jgi:hypothetical protein
MFSGNEWVILIIVMGMLVVLPVLIVAVVLGARRGREIQATSPVVTGPMQQGPAPGWYPDPTGRHEQRYWDGAVWTDAVVSNGQPGTAPI